MPKTVHKNVHSKQKNVAYTKHFMTELQCTIACSACNTNDILGAGELNSNAMLAGMMHKFYFLSTIKDCHCVSHVKIFLGCNQKYKLLFNEFNKGYEKICTNLHKLEGSKYELVQNLLINQC